MNEDLLFKIEYIFKNLLKTMKRTKRFPFTDRENLIIKQSVKLFGEDWTAISRRLPGRTPKQIHYRYINYLKDGLISCPWTVHEDEMLISMYKSIGPKWSKMMKNLPGRSGNDIKNRWHKHLYKSTFRLSENSDNQTSKDLINSDIQTENKIFTEPNNENQNQDLFNNIQSNKILSNDTLGNIKSLYLTKFQGIPEPKIASTYESNTLSQQPNQLDHNVNNMKNQKIDQIIGQNIWYKKTTEKQIIKVNNCNIWGISTTENEFKNFEKNPTINSSIFNHDFEMNEIFEEFTSQNFDFQWI